MNANNVYAIMLPKRSLYAYTYRQTVQKLPILLIMHSSFNLPLPLL